MQNIKNKNIQISEQTKPKQTCRYRQQRERGQKWVKCVNYMVMDEIYHV